MLSGVLAGCGLPLPGGVRTPGLVPEERPRSGGVAVLPPGPAPGATPRDLVEDFLAAQKSPEDDHAVARQFLTPEAAEAWDDDAGVRVYDPSRPLVIEQTTPESVRVVAQLAAVVSPDGSYRRASGSVSDDYRVVCQGDRCRIADLEPGLRLSPGDLVRSFAPRAVHFLAPSSGEATAGAHLVADLVWLPRTQQATRLVQAVLDGPSRALEDSVASAVPPGTRLLGPVRTASDGTVTVDLSGEVARLDDPARQRLSAQLVWTLRGLGTGFSRLRLRVEGGAFPVDGSSAPQPASSWPAYDPERLRPRAPALYLEDRALRSLVDGGLSTSAATEGQLPVDLAAASPDGFLALLTSTGDGEVALRTGPQAGPFDTVRATGALTSPTWGSGEQGLFLLRRGGVVLLPAEGPLQEVPVDGESRPVRRLQVARDGVRVALLVGDAERPDLLVGRLQAGPDGPRVVGLREIVPTLGRVVDLAWETGTSLVVLADQPLGVLPVRLAVDGFAGPAFDSRLPQGVTPVALTAAAGRPLVLAGRKAGEQVDRLYRDNGSAFVPEATGRAPFYPG